MVEVGVPVVWDVHVVMDSGVVSTASRCVGLSQSSEIVSCLPLTSTTKYLSVCSMTLYGPS